MIQDVVMDDTERPKYIFVPKSELIWRGEKGFQALKGMQLEASYYRSFLQPFRHTHVVVFE